MKRGKSEKKLKTFLIDMALDRVLKRWAQHYGISEAAVIRLAIQLIPKDDEGLWRSIKD